jgi:hypothetical protein
MEQIAVDEEGVVVFEDLPLNPLGNERLNTPIWNKFVFLSTFRVDQYTLSISRSCGIGAFQSFFTMTL